MSSSVPAPSKGALRALRHIALGTSCTVAFGAGLVTEDRRRRIHIAREASENARRLKTSRKYHNAGLLAPATSEEQVESNYINGPWNGSDEHTIQELDWDNTHPGCTFKRLTLRRVIPRESATLERSDEQTVHEPDCNGTRQARAFKRLTLGRVIAKEDDTFQPNHKQTAQGCGLGSTSLDIALITRVLSRMVSASTPTRSRQFQQIDVTKMTSQHLQNPTGLGRIPGAAKNAPVSPTKPPKVRESVNAALRSSDTFPDIGETPQANLFQKMDERTRAQSELASEMYKILGDVSRKRFGRAAEAASVFHEAFQGDTVMQPMNEDLLDACISLGRVCTAYEKIDIFIPVLSRILSCGHAIDEESLHKLQFEEVISRLLEQSGYEHALTKVVRGHGQLRHAVAIFIAKTREKHKPLPMELREVGLQLCTATNRANLYDLTEAVYRRLVCARTDFTAAEVECLILSLHRRAFGSKVLSHFLEHFSKTDPNTRQLDVVVQAAVDSALVLGKHDVAEEILMTASQMARKGNLRTFTTWHLKVLGEHWRANRNIATTQALFARLQVFSDQTNRPQAMYTSMIQFCIEAGREDEASQYLDRLEHLVGRENMGVRIYGHFALAKALKNDWAGVEADFGFMKKFAEKSAHEHSAVFVPILKQFIASHDTGQAEKFVRFYLEDMKVAPNQYIFNIMVNVYCKAGEFSNCARWIEYAGKLGFPVDSVTINTILSSCRRWDIRPLGLSKQYRRSPKKLDQIFDFDTSQILRRAAFPRVSYRCLGSTLSVRSRKPMSIKHVKPLADHECEKIEAAMSREFDRGDYAKVLKYYKFTMTGLKRLSHRGLELAVRASIKSGDGDLSSVTQILDDARSRGLDVSPVMTHLFLRELDALDCSGHEFATLAKQTLAENRSRGLKESLYVASKIISELVDRRKPKEALILWRLLASDDNHIACQLVDVVILTVLLRAHILLSDLAGIKWVMSVLLDNNIKADGGFKRVIKKARGEARWALEARPDSHFAKQLYEVLDECVQLVSAQRVNDTPKRDAAEKLILLVTETALAAKPAAIQKAALPVRRSQRGRSSKEMWAHVGLYAKIGRRQGKSDSSLQRRRRGKAEGRRRASGVERANREFSRLPGGESKAL